MGLDSVLSATCAGHQGWRPGGRGWGGNSWHRGEDREEEAIQAEIDKGLEQIVTPAKWRPCIEVQVYQRGLGPLRRECQWRFLQSSATARVWTASNCRDEGLLVGKRWQKKALRANRQRGGAT